jgi:Ca2+-binding RTX toxin-like protein
MTATALVGEFVGARTGGDRLNGFRGGGRTSPLVLYGDTSQDGARHAGRAHHHLGSHFGPKPFDALPQLPAGGNEDADWILPIGNLYKCAGNDTIIANTMFADLGGAKMPTVGIAAYGGAGHDILFGTQGSDRLAGGSGNDGILGLGGPDIAIGDSGINVYFATRALRYATVEASPAPPPDPAVRTSGRPHRRSGPG